MIFENFLIISRSVLAAPIRMVQQGLSRIPTTKGHPQRIHGQLAGHPGGGRPTDHLPVEQIQEHGQIQPSLIGRDVGNIANPDMIRSINGKVLIQKVWRYRKVMPGIGRCLEFLFGSRPYASLTHDPGNTVFPAPNAVIDKVLMNFGCSVYAVACSMKNANLGLQNPVLTPSAALWTLEPSMVSGTGNVE
jgi:hypothetical protein